MSVNLEDSLVAILSQHAPRLQAALQRASGDSQGPEEGSDAWLLLNAFITNNTISGDGQHFDDTIDLPSLAPSENSHDLAGNPSYATSLARLEDSGRHLAEQGGTLPARLQGLQAYIEALSGELHHIFRDQPQLLAHAISRLYQLQSACVLALTRGYQIIVDQMSQESHRLAHQLTDRLQSLQRINSAANSATDLDQTLQITAQAVASELGADLCSIFFYDELQRILTLRATNGPRPLGGMHFTQRLGEGYSGWVADKGHPLLVRDALADPQFASEVRTYSTDYHGLMAVPIIFFGDVARLVGVISIQSLDPRDFTPEDINFVEVIAGIIAINLENGLLYEQTDEQLRRKVHELATIHRVSSIIASTLNLDEVLQIITTQAVHLSGAERSCIFAFDPDQKHLHILAHYGLNEADVRRIQVPTGQCCVGRTVQTGKPCTAVDCFQHDEGCFMRQDPLVATSLLASDIHSVLCVPLEVKGKVLGCICIYSSHRHPLTPEQMQLVVIFANEAAIALENARLFEEARSGLELKSILLSELHHRVKNNLATVAGILSLQQRRTKSPEVSQTLAECVNRVQGLAATHDLLSHEDMGDSRVDEIARKIVGVANAHLRPPETHITFHVEPCAVVLPSQSVYILALVLNEMVSNAIKHGIAKMKEGVVTVRGREEDGIVIIEVIDTGNGPPLEEGTSQGIGLLLIKNLIGDLAGQFALRRVDGRTVSEIRFPIKRPHVAVGAIGT
jgi:GAF domain-containing protein/anti-sigma regulatory factor (Ser/Thr protein kinase)